MVTPAASISSGEKFPLPAGKLLMVAVRGPQPCRGEAWIILRPLNGTLQQMARGPLRRGSGRDDQVVWLGSLPVEQNDAIQVSVHNVTRAAQVHTVVVRMEIP